MLLLCWCLQLVLTQKSFEEVQAAVRARKQQEGDAGGGDSTGGAAAGQHYITSSWADNARGRFVAGRPGDPSIPSGSGGGEVGGGRANTATQQLPRPHGVGGASVRPAAGETAHPPQSD